MMVMMMQGFALRAGGKAARRDDLIAAGVSNFKQARTGQ